MGLTDERGGGIAYSVARHIAQALGGDGKGVGGNGDVAQWCHYHGADDLCTAHQNVLYGQGNAYLEGIAHVFAHPAEANLVLTQVENLVVAGCLPKVGQRDADISQGGSEGCAHHAHVQHIDEDVIEHDVAQADQNSHDAGRVHVACGLEHHARHVVQVDKGQHEAVDQEIGR